jgi:hypothetical protein
MADGSLDPSSDYAVSCSTAACLAAAVAGLKNLRALSVRLHAQQQATTLRR